MKIAILSLSLLLASKVFANEAARSFVREDLALNAQAYGISSYEVGDYLGVINKKYSFSLKYTKAFCKVEICETLQCATVIGLDSDAIVDFESEQDSTKCDHLQ